MKIKRKIEWEPIISMVLEQVKVIPKGKREKEIDYFLKEVLVRTSTQEIFEKLR